MTNNVYGIDLGTCNMKIYCKSSNKILNEKNTIALKNKDEIYKYFIGFFCKIKMVITDHPQI